MNQNLKFNKNDLIFVVLILVSLIALVNVFVLMNQYSSGTQEQALTMAAAYAGEVGEKYSKRMDFVREKTRAVASLASRFDNRTELDAYLDDLKNDRYFAAYIDDEVRYFKGEHEYNQRGEEIASTKEIVEVTSMRKNGEVATYGIIYDDMGTSPRVACYCPVEGSSVLDGLLIYYRQDAILEFVMEVDDEHLAYCDLMAVCCQNYGGAQILTVLSDSTGNVKVNDSFYDAIATLTNDMAPVATISALLDSGKSESEHVTLNGTAYVLSVQRADPTDQGLYVIGLYRERTVYSSSFDLVETAIITMGILLVVLFVFSFYFVASRRRISKRIEQINMEDSVLHCPTQQYFEKEARASINQHRGSAFAVVVSHIQHFQYILETYGEGAAQNILKHIADLFANSMRPGETFGHMTDGDFVLLMQYGEIEHLINRLTVLLGIANKSAKGNGVPADYDLKMLYGIYVVENKNEPVSKMVDRALSVSDMPSRTDINNVCNFYDAQSMSNYMRKAEIENRMETALKAGEFRVFYQPKYNLDDDRIDGAELLVRWYDTKTRNYRSPAEFLPVFEENGFISKLDRHIYFTACETLTNWIKEGRRVYPISVNISRITAIQPDFLEYYIGVKKHFNIADKFITLEFTESFAYENYEYLSVIAKELRKAGFLCSLDDFGTGYSTYSVLKSLEMDEIKLDKFFLDVGKNTDVDKLILDSVISMGKRMGLKVTQEGVETLEELEVLREEGCNVIQGYYFARPMSGSDYIAFIERFNEENPILKAEKELKKKNAVQ